MFLPIISSAQIACFGRVADALSGKPIAYATLALKHQNTGVNADDSGVFRFNLAANVDDTLIVSSAGYQTLYMSLHEWKDGAIIMLSRNERLLKPVIVKSEWIYSDAGKFKVKPNHFFTSGVDQYQVARKLRGPVAEAWLDKALIATGNRGGHSKFMVRVYELDHVTGGPGKELTDSAIIVISKGRLATVDIRPYQIFLPGREFFISVEWLLIPENEYVFKFGGKGELVTKQISYKPVIHFSQDVPVGKSETWGKVYSGEWKPILTGQNGLSISAMVRY
jgi:hypothetical protein